MSIISSDATYLEMKGEKERYEKESHNNEVKCYEGIPFAEYPTEREYFIFYTSHYSLM